MMRATQAPIAEKRMTNKGCWLIRLRLFVDMVAIHGDQFVVLQGNQQDTQTASIGTENRHAMCHK